MALESLKTDKAVEPDGIPSEMLKLGGETVTKALHSIIETVWTTGQWQEDCFVPLYKKGDQLYAQIIARYR